MSSQRRPSQDESKTYDQSIVIHDDVVTNGTSVTMDELLTTRSVPHSNANKSHSRNISVGTMIPHRYLNQAPSLIALLDVQKSRSAKINIPITKFNLSKSVPDYGNNKDTHMPESPTLNSEDDFDTIVPRDINDNNKSRQSIDKSTGKEAMRLIDHSSNDSVVIHMHNDDQNDKEIEYEKLIEGIGNNIQNDEMVDMQLLAAKAAEEFTVLANENDILLKENMRMKEKYDDIQHEHEKLLFEISSIKNKYENNNDLVTDIDILKSKAKQWDLEKKLLMEQLETTETRKKRGSSSTNSINGRNISKLKLKRDTSEDAHTLMMESLAQITREKNELETRMEMEKQMKREYEFTISNLKKELTDREIERNRLSNDLDKQQQLYISLKQNAKKKELEIDTIVGRNRNMTLEQEEQQQQQKEEVLNQLAEKTAYIQHLEQENQKLMAAKIKDDDQMFYELRQLRSHKFQRSMQFDAMSNLVSTGATSSDGGNTHSRDPSMSNYSQSGFGIFTHQSNADLGLKTARTQINLFSAEDFDNIEEEDIIIDMEPPQPYDDDDNIDMETPQPNQPKKKVSFLIPNKTDQKEKEKQQKKREEMFKINAEIEFFLMTCIAVKQNLAEEYPDKPEVMTENPMQLFEVAQKEHVVMNKFNLWLEYQLREKYDLPKIEGFQKILEKYHVKENLKKGLKKTKKGTKKLAKKTEKVSIKAGHYIAGKAEELEARIRAYSQAKQGDDETYDNKEQGNDTIEEGNEISDNEHKENDQFINDDTTEKDIKLEMEMTNDKNKQNHTITTTTTTDDKTVNENNTSVNNVDNKQCCIIL